MLTTKQRVDPLTARWWSGLSEDERQKAWAEAESYLSLGEEGRDRVRNDGAESAGAVEGDEVEFRSE
jgi:hypothetical protein